MQLFMVHCAAPPPRPLGPEAELPVSVQLFSVQPEAPPPSSEAELLLKVQLFKVPPAAPPPPEAALPEKTQLETTSAGDSDHTPPPMRACPLVKAKPERFPPRFKETHRTDWPPSMAVNCGPLTLCNLRNLLR